MKRENGLLDTIPGKVGRMTKIKNSTLNTVSNVKRDRMFMEDVESDL